MSPDLPTVSVVIPARDAADTLARALESVAAQTYPNTVEVIVAAADEESAEVATQNGALVVSNPTGSTPHGLNLAISSSSGQVIVRCDAQAVLPPGYIGEGVSTLLETGADNVGGMQVPLGRTKWELAIAAAMRSALGSGMARYRVGGEEGPAETVYLGIYRRDALERLGGFDEVFSRTQDYELNHRIIESGGLVWFNPRLEVTYYPRDSLKALARQYFEYGRAKRLFARKHPGSLQLRQMAAPVLVAILGVSLIGALWWPILLVLPLSYGIALIVGSKGDDASTLRVAGAVAVMHVSWGAGFLRP